ncbi:hypothetical protein [Acidiplasma cupricumulans]|uniref:hypothetical protein n=1 Tax=Acidiplasma cupricumulans TaxID=312540 RepID=UPI00191BF16F|nr:hypothetical protein [Acidiplasma cupricumulans]
MSLTFSVRASNNLILTTIPLISKYYLNFNSVLIGILSASAMGSTGIMSALINSRLDSKKRRKLFISSVLSIQFLSRYSISPTLIISGYSLYFQASFLAPSCPI